MSLRLREIVIPLAVGLGVALIQAVFTGPDLVRLLVYFLVGLSVATLAVVVFRFASHYSRRSVDGLTVSKFLDAPATPYAIAPNAKGERVWLSIAVEDVIAYEKMPNMTRNERDRLVAPYIGQWVRVAGQVEDVNGTPDKPVVAVSIKERGHHVDAQFTQHKVRASSLRKGVAVQVIGQIRAVFDFGVQIRDSEFVEPQKSLSPSEIADEATEPVPPAVPSMSDEIRDYLAARELPRIVKEFSGRGVGKTSTFQVTRDFGFAWGPKEAIAVAHMHGTLNGIPHSWAFGSNPNPYYPYKFGPPPDAPGDFYFTIDNIRPETKWWITVLYED